MLRPLLQINLKDNAILTDHMLAFEAARFIVAD